MKTSRIAMIAAGLAVAGSALAHPGHGQEGPLHLLLDHAGLVLATLAALAAAVYFARRGARK